MTVYKEKIYVMIKITLLFRRRLAVNVSLTATFTAYIGRAFSSISGACLNCDQNTHGMGVVSGVIIDK